MVKLELTDPFIKSHPPTEKTLEISDSKATGLVVRITPTGYKSFVYRYRFGNQVKRFTIGSFPKVKLSKARKIVTELHLKVKQGIDPLAEMQKKKEAPEQTSFKELADRYKKIHLPPLRDKTKDEYKRIIDVELVPGLGKTLAKEVTRRQVIALLDEKAIAQGKKAMANRIRARLHSIYEFGISRGIVESNPVSAVGKYTEGETKRERYYSEKEIQALWMAFEQQEQPTQTVLKILLICGQRSKETRHMKWKDIQGNVWTIPGSLSKSKRAHDVPLPDMAVELIEALRPVTGKSEFVFESPKKKNQPVGWIKRSVKNVKDESGVTDFRLHDLRRTAATYMAKLGVERTVLGKILNHKGLAGDGQVTAIYDRHSYLDEKRKALQRWSYHLQQILEVHEEPKIHKIG